MPKCPNCGRYISDEDFSEDKECICGLSPADFSDHEKEN
jgi:hypothetical protein